MSESAPTQPAPRAQAPEGVEVDDQGLPDEAVLRRAEEKPPLYRFFRGGIYVAYMAVVVWFVLGVVMAAYHAVWSDEAEQLRKAEQAAGGHDPSSSLPAP